MKKVLLIDLAIDKLGGAERVINTLANTLSASYCVDVCSVYKYSETPFYKYQDNIKRIYLIDLSKLPSTKSKSVVSFVFFRSFEKIIEMTFYNKTIKDYCNTKLRTYDVIIFGRTMAAVDFLPYMETYKGKVIVRDATHLYDTFKRDKILMKKYFPSRVDVFIVSSEESINAYTDFFRDNTIKIKKIYNPLGISPKMVNNMEYKQITGVGRYSKEKGFDNLIKAFAIVYSKYPDWSLILLGAGQECRRYQKLCKRLGIMKAVVFRKSEDIVEDYCKTGIFVMTSRHEGYANALVEALACGVPSISFNWYMGVDDIIQDGHTGCIVKLKNRDKYYKSIDEKENVENLAEKIVYLIENPEVRERLSENAIEIRKTRKLEKIINEWIALIEE